MSAGQDADNYSFVNYSAFADLWNETVLQKEFGDQFQKTDMTMQTAGLLKQCSKEFRRHSNEVATLKRGYRGAV